MGARRSVWNRCANVESLTLNRIGEAYLYQSFGLIIRSTLPLPELLPWEDGGAGVEREPDVTIRIEKMPCPSEAVGGARRYIRPAPEGIYLGWGDVGEFLVRGGREIIVAPAPGVDESLLRLFLLGTTMAVLLHQRGEAAVLHASVVTVAGQAVAFVGAKGYGKLTTAASLLARGHKILSDDILAVDLRPDAPLALPGFPHMKLWPDSLSSLGHDPALLPRLRPELEKRGQRLGAGYAQAPAPLTGIFVLDHGPEPLVTALHAWDALTALMPHWYAARFGPDLLRALGMSSHFLQCAELTKRVPVCRLTRPNDLNALPEIARRVETWCSRAAT